MARNMSPGHKYVNLIDICIGRKSKLWHSNLWFVCCSYIYRAMQAFYWSIKYFCAEVNQENEEICIWCWLGVNIRFHYIGLCAYCSTWSWFSNICLSVLILVSNLSALSNKISLYFYFTWIMLMWRQTSYLYKLAIWMGPPKLIIRSVTFEVIGR